MHVSLAIYLGHVMAVGDAHVFPGSLTLVLTQFFFPKPPTTFLTCFCRGKRRKYAGKKVRLNRGSNSQPPGHESNTLTTEPPGRCYILFKTEITILSKFLSSVNSLNLAQSKPLSFGKEITLSQTKNFRLFQTEFADDNFKFNKNGRKVTKRVENTAGKGEIARYKQFLLFPQCSQKTLIADT